MKEEGGGLWSLTAVALVSVVAIFSLIFFPGSLTGNVVYSMDEPLVISPGETANVGSGDSILWNAPSSSAEEVFKDEKIVYALDLESTDKKIYYGPAMADKDPSSPTFSIVEKGKRYLIVAKAQEGVMITASGIGISDLGEEVFLGKNKGINFNLINFKLIIGLGALLIIIIILIFVFRKNKKKGKRKRRK